MSYTSSCPEAVNETVRCLLAARNLRTLEMTPRNMALQPEQLHALGMLPLTELRLNSFMYNQQPAINRASQSHLDNEGVRALVDSICHRVNARAGTPLPHAPPSALLCPRSPPFSGTLAFVNAVDHEATSFISRWSSCVSHDMLSSVV